jgi:hypothetical protein
MALLCAAASANADDGLAPSTLTITARTPEAEIHIRGVSLKSVRADDAQNAVAFDFNGPVSDTAFTQLQAELPDWVEMAYAGYDNAVIRAKRPVTFMTRAEADGFSLRMVPREGAPGAPPASLRGADDAGGAPPPALPAYSETHGFSEVQTFFARAAAERPYDVAIRGFYDALRDGGASTVALSGDWRQSHGTTLIASNAHADFDVWSGVRLLGDVNDVVVNTKNVRRIDGTLRPFDKNDLSGSAGVAVPIDGAVATAELLYGRAGFGGRLGVTQIFDDWQLGMRAAYREPYIETAEAVADRATRDYSALYAAGQILDGLWGAAEIKGMRYSLKGDVNVAHTAGFHAGLRYDIEGLPLSLTYDADGEYVIGAHKYAGTAPTPYVPLSIRTREVHQFGGSFSERMDEQFWFDLYGGYAIDRYSNDGPYGGLALRFTPAPGFDIAVNGRYSTVAEREGERGDVVSAGLRLNLALDDAPLASRIDL